MERRITKLFDRSTVRSLLRIEDTIKVIEQAFMELHKGNVMKPELMHVDADEGEFHIKGGGIKKPRSYFALKSNGGFFNNKNRYDIPNIQGLILLHDGEKGTPIAVFESGEITIQRTGALTAVGAKYLSVKDAQIATICGCGIQGRIQLESLVKVREIKKAFAYDLDYGSASSFSEQMSEKLKLDVVPVKELKEAAIQSDIIVTCTPAKKFYLKKEFVREGCFVAAVGSDSPDKQEIDPALIAENKLVVDIAEQCIQVGDTHHAIKNNLITAKHIYAELSEVVGGSKAGRENEKEIIVFDATGSGLQDAATAAFVYEKSFETGSGVDFEFWK